MACGTSFVYPNGHLAIGGLKADYNNYKAYGARDDTAAFPGAHRKRRAVHAAVPGHNHHYARDGDADRYGHAARSAPHDR